MFLLANICRDVLIELMLITFLRRLNSLRWDSEFENAVN